MTGPGELIRTKSARSRNSGASARAAGRHRPGPWRTFRRAGEPYPAPGHLDDAGQDHERAASVAQRSGEPARPAPGHGPARGGEDRVGAERLGRFRHRGGVLVGAVGSSARSRAAADTPGSTSPSPTAQAPTTTHAWSTRSASCPPTASHRDRLADDQDAPRACPTYLRWRGHTPPFQCSDTSHGVGRQGFGA